MKHLSLPKVRRLKLPFLPSIAFTLDPNGSALVGKLYMATNLRAVHIRDGKPLERRNLGSGLITVTLANTLVSDAVTGTSVVPTLARFKFFDSGTGVTAATDGDTALQTASGVARVTAALSNGQTATTGNHLAKLQYVGTISYSSSLAITEFGIFDASTVGNLMDHKIFGAFNVVSGDSIQFTYLLSLPSNG